MPYMIDDGVVYERRLPPAGERELFEISRAALGWRERIDPATGHRLLRLHTHGKTWFGSKDTMPTYVVPWTEAQWIGWRDRAALAKRAGVLEGRLAAEMAKPYGLEVDYE